MLRLLRRLLGVFVRFRKKPAAAPSAPVAPGTAKGTVAPLRETAAHAAAPRRVVRWRTRLAGLMAASGAGLFGAFGWLVGDGMLAEPDLVASVGVQQAEHPLLLSLLALVSQFGSWPLNALSVVAAMAAFWLAGFRVESLFAGLAALGAALLGSGLKLLWLRPRPSDDAIRVVGAAAGFSFPSGHTLFFVGFFGFLFYWSYAFLRRGRLRTALLWLFGLLIALVGPSRVYLGHHWTSDVLAAYALGFAYLVVIIRLYGAVRLRAAAAGAAAPRHGRPAPAAV